MKALTKKRSNKHWTDMNQAVSLMDVAWLSIESVVSYEVLKLRLAMRAELGDRTSIIKFTTLPIIIGMSSTCVCICPGCVTHISCQDASPGHMAIRASCCRCDKNMPTFSPQLVECCLAANYMCVCMCVFNCSCSVLVVWGGFRFWFSELSHCCLRCHCIVILVFGP